MLYSLIQFSFLFLQSGTQQYQIMRLRTKYNNVILSSHLNEYRNQIQQEAKQLYNKDAEEKLFALVRESAARKARISSGELKERESITKKTVTFATQLTTTFEEAAKED